MTSEIFKKWLMSWDMEFQQKMREILLVLDSCATHPHLDSLKNNKLEFLSPSTTTLVQPSDMVIIKKLKTLYSATLVNYIVETIQENLLTSSSAAKEVIARTDLIQPVHFIPDSWQRIPRPFRTSLFTVVLNTQTWRCQIRPIVKMSHWKCTTLEITKSLHALTIVFNVIMIMKIVRKQLLSKLQ
jgi:hypothetical protein